MGSNVKNDITYEYRVFTNRLVDVESMEVGKCTSKNLKNLKQKDKVDGRFFHTSDTDEWFFCWGGELQKLNLKGNSDVNAALDEVKKLISDANTAVADAKNAANEALKAASKIDGKADKSDVDVISQAVDSLSEKVNGIEVPSLDGYAKLTDIPEIPSLDGYAKKEDLSGYVTTEYVDEKISDLLVINDSDSVSIGVSLKNALNEEYYTKSYIDDLFGNASDIAENILNV